MYFSFKVANLKQIHMGDSSSGRATNLFFYDDNREYQ